MENRHWKIVQTILNKYPYNFYAYGSRVKGKIKKTSDLDICYQERISNLELTQLWEDFAESDLPFEVEVVSWENMRPIFKKIIQKDLVLISTSNKATSHL